MGSLALLQLRGVEERNPQILDYTLVDNLTVRGSVPV